MQLTGMVGAPPDLRIGYAAQEVLPEGEVQEIVYILEGEVQEGVGGIEILHLIQALIIAVIVGQCHFLDSPCQGGTDRIAPWRL